MITNWVASLLGRVRAFLPWLLAAALVEWVGTGLFLAVSTVFFVKVVGLTPGQVGPGLTIAAVVAMAAVLPVGRLADRYGPRNVLILINLMRAAATACFLLVHGWWGFLAVSVLIAVTDQAAPALIQALVGDLTGSDRRTRVLAVHRSVINVGLSIGGLTAGILLGVGLEHVFQVLLLADAAAFVAAAALLCKLPGRPTPRPRDALTRWRVLRDTRLLALTAYDSVMCLWQPMLNIAFPLWLITRTDAPVSLVGILYATATMTCIILQYPISIRAGTPRQALHGYVWAGLCLATASLGFAAAPAVSDTATVAVLAAAVITLTIGELFQVGSAWTLSFAIAPPDQRTTYLAAFGLGRATGRAAGPLLMTGVVLALGEPGWILLAAVHAAAAVAPAIVAKRRHHQPPPRKPCTSLDRPTTTRRN
ncbi:MFS transporter [Actinomadura sp. 9N215]|uniref:MFS transporter n=1 Tax=Actinomadura sp. 9N215 TaxID=3375150 RepID=UPI0037BCA2B1